MKDPCNLHMRSYQCCMDTHAMQPPADTKECPTSWTERVRAAEAKEPPTVDESLHEPYIYIYKYTKTISYIDYTNTFQFQYRNATLAQFSTSFSLGHIYVCILSGRKVKADCLQHIFLAAA